MFEITNSTCGSSRIVIYKKDDIVYLANDSTIAGIGENNFSEVYGFYDRFSCLKRISDGKWIILDKEKGLIIKDEAGNIWELDTVDSRKYGVFAVSKNNKYFYIDENGVPQKTKSGLHVRYFNYSGSRDGRYAKVMIKPGVWAIFDFKNNRIIKMPHIIKDKTTKKYFVFYDINAAFEYLQCIENKTEYIVSVSTKKLLSFDSAKKIGDFVATKNKGEKYFSFLDSFANSVVVKQNIQTIYYRKAISIIDGIVHIYGVKQSEFVEVKLEEDVVKKWIERLTIKGEIT